MRARKRRQRIIGLLPRLAQGLWAWGAHAARHPQSLILGGVLLIGLWGLWGYAQRADAFRITQVVLPPDSTLKIRDPLLHAKLWELDIRTVANELKQQQPWVQDVRVIRQLPNAVRIQVIPRRPVAQVRIDLPAPRNTPGTDLSSARQAGKWYPVDQTGFILPQWISQPADHLVRLVGVERSGMSLKVGKANTDERLLLALRVLGKLRRIPSSVSRRLTEINVADPQQIRFLMDLSALPAAARQQGGVPSGTEQAGGEIEVRCGAEPELDAHLARFQAALKAVAKQPFAVKYIDVRFRDPVIGPRT